MSTKALWFVLWNILQMAAQSMHQNTKPYIYFFHYSLDCDRLEKVNGSRCMNITKLLEIPNSQQYSEVAFSGCEYLCQNLHNVTCSRVFYFPYKRTCVLTPRMEISMTSSVNGCAIAVVYERHRCPGM